MSPAKQWEAIVGMADDLTQLHTIRHYEARQLAVMIQNLRDWVSNANPAEVDLLVGAMKDGH